MATLEGPVRIVVFVGFLLLLQLARPRSAHALCLKHPEEGTWFNVDPNATGIAKIVISAACKDTGPTTEADWHVTVYGVCSPTNCPWGKRDGRKVQGGIYVRYEFSFVRVQLFARLVRKPSTNDTGVLEVYTESDFRDPKRHDYFMWEYFVLRKPLTVAKGKRLPALSWSQLQPHDGIKLRALKPVAASPDGDTAPGVKHSAPAQDPGPFPENPNPPVSFFRD